MDQPNRTWISNSELNLRLKQLLMTIRKSPKWQNEEFRSIVDELELKLRIGSEHLPSDYQEAVQESLEYCDLLGMGRLMETLGLPRPPTFDINSDYDSNVNRTPRSESAEPVEKMILQERKIVFCGLRLGFPMGLSSSVLTASAQWIAYYASKGFDLITYKTVRHRYAPPHPMPQWVPLSPCPQFGREDLLSGRPVIRARKLSWLSERQRQTTANSFGIPSQAPEIWKKDVARAKATLNGYQALAVSVYGEENTSEFREVCDAYAQTAIHAVDAGADLIEVNLSSPNVRDYSGRRVEYYSDPDRSLEIIRVIANRMEDKGLKVPILAKIGYLPEEELLNFLKVVGPELDGISAINTLPMPIENEDKNNCFPPTAHGASRLIAGVSGDGVRSLAQEAISTIVKWRRQNRPSLGVIAIGGVMTPKDFVTYLRIGADVVQCCTGAWLNDGLAIECRNFLHSPIRN